MAIIIPVGYGQASLIVGLSGALSDFVCTIGYLPAETDPAGNAEAIRSAWATTGGGFTANVMGSAYTFRGVSVTEMGLDGPLVGASLIGQTGTGAPENPPPNCAVLVRKNTNRGGRKGRGRMYLPACCVPETNTNNRGVIDDGNMPGLTSRLQQSLTAMATGGCPAYLLHEDGSAGDLITGLVPQALMATQRRRLR